MTLASIKSINEPFSVVAAKVGISRATYYCMKSQLKGKMIGFFSHIVFSRRLPGGKTHHVFIVFGDGHLPVYISATRKKWLISHCIVDKKVE